MKNILLPAFMLLYSTGFTQRFIPVLQQGDSFQSIVNIEDNKIFDAELYQGNLVIGGSFEMIITEEIENLAVWDGSSVIPFSPLPATDGNDRISRILPYDSGFIIFGKLDEYNDAAIFNGAEWITMGWNNPYDMIDIDIYEGIPYVINEDPGNTSVQKYDNGNWVQTGQPMSGEMMDLTTFNDKLVITYVVDEEISVVFYDGQSWTTQNLPDNFELNCLSVVNDQLFAGGSVEGEMNAPVILVHNGIESFVNSGIAVDPELGRAGNITGYNGGYLVGDRNRAVSAGSDAGPTKTCFSTGSSYSELLPLGVNEVLDYNGKTYAFICLEGGRHKPFSTVHQGEDVTNITNGILKPYFSPGASSLQRPSKAGFLFPDSQDPIHQERSTLYCTTPWMYGIDEEDTIVSAATFFGINQDICFGPVTDNPDASFMEKYFRVWTLSAEEITYHQTHHIDQGYMPDTDIASWPAHGRPGTSEAEFLAPFVDINGNNIYEPMSGDYPHIKGDVCAYWMFHDGDGYVYNENEYETTSPDSLSIETHAMAYLFTNDDGVIGNTLFYNYRMVNRSDRNYEKFHAAIWTDFDIGTFVDDYVGCDTSLHFMYGYNADPEDEASSVSSGYQEYPPAQGVVFLNQEMTNHVYYNIGSNPINGDPSHPMHYFNYMNSQWKNGQHMLTGGNGVSGAGVSDVETSYMFPSYPWENGWNESQNPGGDRRAMASGEPSSLNAGDCICFDLAYVVARNTSATSEPQYASLELLQNNVPIVRTFYNSLNESCSCAVVGLNELTSFDNVLDIYPNPGNNLINIRVPAEHVATSLTITDANGRIVKSMLINASTAIDVSGLPSSVYLISLRYADHFVSERWIKI